MMLARSLWPRSGGDRANRSAAAVPGPHVLPRFRRVSLPPSAAPSDADVSGAVVAADGSLRVCHRGVLSALTQGGTVLWQADLAALVKDDVALWHGLPTALADNRTLVPLPYALAIIAVDGHIDDLVEFEEPMDDSGLPPNITHSGRPVVSSLLGTVYLLGDGRWVAIGDYGYDIVCPALYDDDSLAIAGYGGAGFCRVDLDGTIRWQSQLQDADLVPTVNRRQVAAVGSVNDGVSAFFAPDGAQVGHYAQAAVFAAYGDGWVALSETRLARLSADGTELWGQGVPMQRVRGRRSIVQPVVDAEGYIYVRHDEGLRCCDPEGRRVFEVALPTTRPDPLSIIAPGVIACVSEDELLIGEA